MTGEVNAAAIAQPARKDAAGAVAALLLPFGFVAAATALALAAHAFSLPRGDDWAYRRIALNLATSGHLRLVGWNDATTVGHIALAYPVLQVFGRTETALSAVDVAAALIALALVYDVARRFVEPRRAALVVLVLAIFPSYALYSTSFMTDPTAFMAEMACVDLALRGLGARRRAPFFAAAFAAGFLAFTIRELTIAAPVALAVVLAVDARRRRAGYASTLAPTLSFAIAAAGFYLWRQSLEQPVHPFAAAIGENSLYVLAQAFFLLGLGALPLAVFLGTAPLEQLSRRWALALGLGALAVGGLLMVKTHLLAGATVTRNGAVWNDMLAGRRVPLFTRDEWGLADVAGLVGGAYLAVAVVGLAVRTVRGRTLPLPRLLLLTFAACETALLALRAATGGGIDDRYLWPLLVVLLIGLLGAFPRSPGVVVRTTAASAIAGLAALSLVTAADSYTFAAARWHLGRLAVARGAPAGDVDAGFEWVGAHYRGVAGRGPGRPLSTAPREPYLATLFPRAANCYVVSSDAPSRGPGSGRLLAAYEYRNLVLGGRRTLFLLQRNAACV